MQPKQILFTLLALALAGSLSAQDAFFRSQPLATPLTGNFHAEFSAAASSDSLDVVVGLGPVAATAYGDMNMLVRFNPAGTIDVRNGTSYMADNDVFYRANTLYYFEVDVDVAANTYDVSVITPGETKVVLADDYAFRPDNVTGTIAFLSQVQSEPRIDTFLGVSHVQLGDFSADGFFNQLLDAPITAGDFGVKVSAVATTVNANAVFGMGGTQVGSFGDFNVIVRFNDQGFIDVRNGGGYGADVNVPYAPGEEYGFFIEGNIDSKTYDVTVVAPDGTETILATDYAFREDNFTGSLTHVATKNGAGTLGIRGLMVGTIGDDDIYKATSVPRTPLTGNFEVEYALAPSKDSMDGVFALGPVASAVWGDYNALVRFNSSGRIDVRNGGTYEAMTDFVYRGGRSYLARIEGDAVARTYSVFIRDEAHQDEDTLAMNYGFRDQVSGALAFESTKENFGYLAVDDLGFPMPTLSPRPNNPPFALAGADSLTLIIGDDPEVVTFRNINDGDVGGQELTFTLENTNATVASATLDAFNAAEGTIALNIDPLTVGTTTVSLIIMDDGGTENDGIDADTFDVFVTVMEQGRFRTYNITTADGDLGADARVLTGKDDLDNNFGWLGFNTGSGGFNGADNGPAYGEETGIPRFYYAFYFRFDLEELPTTGTAENVTLEITGEMKTAMSAFQEDFVLFAVPDLYRGSDDDGKGQIGELGETDWVEGDCGGCAALNVDGTYITGKENHIVADNAPGFNEMDDLNTASEDFSIFRSDVLIPMGTFSLAEGSDKLVMSNMDMTQFVADDLNQTVTFVLGIGRATTVAFNAWPIYTSENFGQEPELIINWDFQTSVTDLQDAAGIDVFPNPTSGRLNLSELDRLSEVIVHNVYGQRLLSFDARNVSGGIDVSSLPAGTYYVDMIDRNGIKIQVSKFVKH